MTYTLPPWQACLPDHHRSTRRSDADGGGGVEIAAGADVGLEQRQAEVDAQADLFDGGAELAVIGGEAVAPGGSVAVVRPATY
ncbi:MAG TPA: hypothetical protein VE823_01230 [Geodermatophilus sp.]|jgi:hypothetical protein|nr:hypothetical protein [Geodermatophilus sp.]